MLSNLHSRHTGQPHQKGMELGEAWGERRADARKGLRALRGDSMPRIRVHCTRATRNDGQRTAQESAAMSMLDVGGNWWIAECDARC